MNDGEKLIAHIMFTDEWEGRERESEAHTIKLRSVRRDEKFMHTRDRSSAFVRSASSRATRRDICAKLRQRRHNVSCLLVKLFSSFSANEIEWVKEIDCKKKEKKKHSVYRKKERHIAYTYARGAQKRRKKKQASRDILCVLKRQTGILQWIRAVEVRAIRAGCETERLYRTTHSCTAVSSFGIETRLHTINTRSDRLQVISFAQRIVQLVTSTKISQKKKTSNQSTWNSSFWYVENFRSKWIIEYRKLKEFVKKLFEWSWRKKKSVEYLNKFE